MSQPWSALRALDVDPQTVALLSAEERRQRERIILIASESLTPPAVREVLGSALTSVYAEGYPRKAMMQATEEELADVDVQLALTRRYADRRFYKGTEIADIVESLAARRVAEGFATPDVPAEHILANVQPLSGAAANLAVYEAFVKPGETVMGMALTEGGHLTHGSQFNVTGRRYRIVPYAVDPATGRLDYERMRALAREHRPKMIIGGFTSYPWQPDWAAFRRIADDVGAILLADVAHTAGLILGKVYPNPIGHAHVVSFTTHKTLCGARGAVLLSTDAEIAARLDAAVFPGLQGGPHVDKFAALAVALQLARTPEYAALQRRIVENAAHLAHALEANGIPLAYGGTNTHVLLADLRLLPSETGFALLGEAASRILDLAGIVCNKNTLPGDQSAAHAHGLRFGTPWVTQRGMGKQEMEALAGIIASVLREIRPFSYIGLRGELPRGKIALHALESAKRDVASLIARVEPRAGVRPDVERRPGGTCAAFRVRGGRASSLLDQAAPGDVAGLSPGACCSTYFFDEKGLAISPALVGCLGRDEYAVLVPPSQVQTIKAWLVGLSDGYTLFDREDLFRKVEGPAVIEDVEVASLPKTASTWACEPLDEREIRRSVRELASLHPERFVLGKPYFVGGGDAVTSASGPSREEFVWVEAEEVRGRTTPLHEVHVALGAKLVPFAGWQMPVWYTSALEEHNAVRRSAGLFDLGHMGVFQVEGKRATQFLNEATSNYAGWLGDGGSQYAYLFDADGKVLDDIMVYRRAEDRYLVVVNAANEAKDWAWLRGLLEDRWIVDRSRAACCLGRGGVALRDLKEERGVIDLALQGPQSTRALSSVLSPADARRVAALERTQFVELALEGRQILVARTGYTGEPVGYEIFAAAPTALWLWNALLEAGQALGVRPCGLAARDSTRTEAGLPLYGHELEGPLGIDPFEAGFGSYVKLHKPFFIGRSAAVARASSLRRELVRFTVERGERPVRAGAAVLDKNGLILGRVTSSVSLADAQVGLALLERRGVSQGTALLFVVPTETGAAWTPGTRIPVPSRGVVAARFMAKGAPASDDAE
ncbi:MAG: glycine cleavage system aminomethyltransferase GcvT [Candidatus Bipolaricaulota bacterium]